MVFARLDEGTYWIAVRSPGAAPTRHGGITVTSAYAAPVVRIALTRWAAIQGLVLSDTGDPIAGARVRVYFYGRGPSPVPAAAWAPPTADLRADWQGRFVLRRVPAGRSYLIISAPGHVEEYTHQTVDGGDERALAIVMVRAWSGMVRGQMLMPDGETPVADTEFAVQFLARRGDRLSSAGRERITTEAQGRFSIRVTKGIHRAKFTATDLTPVTIELDPSAGATVFRSIRLPPLSGIRGRLATGEPGGRPNSLLVCVAPPGRLASAPLAPTRPPGPDGRFAELAPGQSEWRILGLEPGLYEVFTYAPGMAPSLTCDVVVAEGEIADVVVDLPLTPGAVTGRVVSSDGRPLAGVSVHARPCGGRIRSLRLYARTDELGRYRIGGLTPGRAGLWIMGRMYGYAEPPDENTMVVGGATTENVDLTLFVGGKVSGIVKRRDGKSLRREYRVELDTGPTSYLNIPVGPNGTFRVAYVHPGTYELRLQRMGPGGSELVATREAIAVPEGQTVDGIEFVIEE
ncbi:MAG: carboxypeptidase-like regulatory domain-containing protein [Armatimonadota bacterium]